MDGMLLSRVIDRSVIAWYCVLLIFFVRLFLKKVSRKYCYYLWFVVFLNLCIPFTFVSSFSLVPQRVMEFSVENRVNQIVDSPEEKIEESVLVGNEPENIVIFSGNGATTPYKEELTEVFDEIDASERQNNRNDKRDDSTELRDISGNVWLIWGERIWILGMILFGCYSLGATIRLKRNIKNGQAVWVDAKERIKSLQNLSSPVLWGVFSPTIYLPKDLEDAEKTYIMHMRNIIVKDEIIW